MNVLNFVAYLRVSTKKQELNGLSLETQKLECENFATQNKGVILETFLDVVSGAYSKAKRDGLNNAINYALENECVLLVYSFDRLSRDLQSFMNDILSEKKLKFASVEKAKFYDCASTETELIFLKLEVLFAEMERNNIKQRVKNACKERTRKRNEKIEKGLKVHNVWEFANNAEVKEKRKETQINNALTNPKNLQAYNFAKYLYKEGKTLTEIAKELNDFGYKTIRNCKFVRNSVANLFKLFAKNTRNFDNSLISAIEKLPKTQKEITDLIKSLHSKNHSLNAIAKYLNDRQIKTAKSGVFSAMQIKRIIEKELINS